MPRGRKSFSAADFRHDAARIARATHSEERIARHLQRQARIEKLRAELDALLVAQTNDKDSLYEPE